MILHIDKTTGLYLIAGFEHLGLFATVDAAREVFMSMRRAA